MRPGPPPAPVVDLAIVRDAVEGLGLVHPRDLERFADGSMGDPSRLVRALVRAGKLTSYQAGAILQGKARGLTIGGYLVLDRIGVGGMGVVFKARDRRDGRDVALKILPPSFGREPEAVQRFRREFQIAAHLNHPNIVAAIEASEDRGVQFLTMEYIKGQNLEDLVTEGGSLPIKLALHCAIQAARGLEAAHARRVIHRDIKPANIMLDDSGGVRVLDLGLARVIEATSTLGRSTGGTLTQTGTYMGSVDFLAPEQADDAKTADHRADIYGLGCTLYYLLIGRPPFPGDTLLKRLMAHQERPAPSLQAARPEVPDAIEAIYQKMMAKRPDDRPQSMTEVVEALEACRGSSREAGDASADLKTFARTVMKRAVPRGQARDTSIFARPPGPSGFQFDPDLRLEDLVGDYREEAPPGEISEDRLPPLQPKLIPRVRKRKRRRAAVPIAGALALLAVAILFHALRPGPRPGPEDIRRLSDPVSGAGLRPGPATFRPLFPDDDLAGWVAGKSKLGDWSLADGVLWNSGPRSRGMSVLSQAAYRDFVLRLEFLQTEDLNAKILLNSPPGLARNYFEINLDAGDAMAQTMGSLWVSFEDGKPVYYQNNTDSLKLEPTGSWNTLEIEVIDGRFAFTINGYPITHFLDKNRCTGPHRIGFQAKGGELRVRNVEILEIDEAYRARRPACSSSTISTGSPGRRPGGT